MVAVWGVHVKLWHVLNLIHHACLEVVGEYFPFFLVAFLLCWTELLPLFTNLFKVTGCGRREKHARTYMKEGFQRQKLLLKLWGQVWLLGSPVSFFPWDGQSGSSERRLLPTAGWERAATGQPWWWPQQQDTAPWHQRPAVTSRAEWWWQQVLLVV